MSASSFERASCQAPVRGRSGSQRPFQGSFLDYRRFVQRHYDGLAGALTALTGLLTGHEALAGRLIRPGGFDVRGCQRLLDAACGNGRYARFLVRRADADALVVAFDLSLNMLRRARRRVGSDRVRFAAADVTRLPYADGIFDAIVCGWVLEHLPDPRPGLRELARVSRPGGRLLLLTTEDTVAGRWCGRLWHCRTYRRSELRRIAEECGFEWERELWFSRLHAWLKLGGIVAQLRRR
ncbi:MAG: class I SAM-dependent methyltransferase [Gemmataceae bacterium]|nr:class I SAM-dependent methyltransferase [Gemmataceae bacterium]MDW8263909.1 class I SAM-dependent methyltransferase [Gemmataceae bacterium]